MTVVGSTPVAASALRARDEAFLRSRGYQYSAGLENQMVCLVISGFSLPVGLEPREADLLIRLPPGFPDAAPDMFWTNVDVTAGGRPIPGTEHHEQVVGRMWQRWSRHLGGLWRPGIDDLETYVATIRTSMSAAAGR